MRLAQIICPVSNGHRSLCFEMLHGQEHRFEVSGNGFVIRVKTPYRIIRITIE